MNKKIKTVFVVILETFLITGITVISVLPLSCKITEAGIEIIGGDYTAPVLQNVIVLSERSLELDFSEAVKIKQAVVSPVLSGISDSDEVSHSESLTQSIKAAVGRYGSIFVTPVMSEDETSIVFEFEEDTLVGKKYEIYGVVEDSIGNTLTFAIPFVGYNSNIPQIIMTEIHTGMASQLKSEKELNVRRLEYVEFLALTEGNLAGLEFCSGYAGESKKYVFPAIDIKKGEIFVLHLRNWGEGCVSEEEQDLELAYSTYTGNYRDLWTTQTTKCIGDTTDILVVRNTVSGRIVDAVMYRAADVDSWSDKLKIDYSVSTGIEDIYDSVEVEDGTKTIGLSATKFLYRVNASEIYDAVLNDYPVNYPVQSDAWAWEVTSEATPGSL